MSLIRFNPMFDPFNGLEDMLAFPPSQEGLSRLSGIPLAAGPSLMRGFAPAMDIYETEKAVVVETSLAGVNPDDVKVNVDKGILTVSGESKKEHEVDDKNYYRKEVRSGAFFRQVALPAPVLEDKVSAEFADGVLKITCPKSKEKATDKVNIKIVKKGKK